MSDPEMSIPEISAIVADQAVKCFLCAMIHEDIRLHGKLTGHPYDLYGSGNFPISGKTKHLELERVSIGNRGR